MADFAQCTNCGCKEDGVAVYQCKDCHKIQCGVCASEFHCIHCRGNFPFQIPRLGRIKK